MATFSEFPGREAIEQEIGKRFEKIEKTLERTLEKTIASAMKSPTAARAQAAAERAQEKITTARKSIDDVLLGLEHKGYNLKEPQDLIQTVGRRVLERATEIAEDVRSQVAAKPYSPTWLKELKIPKMSFAGAAKGATEAEVGEQLESLEDSPEEKASGIVVTANPAVASTSLADASKPKAKKKASPTKSL